MESNKDSNYKVNKGPRNNEEEAAKQTIDNSESLYNIVVDDLVPYTRESYSVYPGAERSYYDFSAERKSPYSTNIVEATAHLIKGCLSAGLLSMHVGFMYAGIWTGLVVSVITGLLVTYSMVMIVSSAHKLYIRLRLPKLSYPDLAEVAVATCTFVTLRKFSKLMRYSVDFCLVASMCGTCCIYQIMIAGTMKQIGENLSSTIRDTNMNIRYYLLIVAGPLLILCLIRNLKYLAPFSFIADIFVGICVLATMYYSLQQAGKITDRAAWTNFSGLLQSFGICLYSIDGVVVIMPIENSMKKPQNISMVLQYGMTIVIILVTCVGFFGYWGWGEKCRSPITTHLPSDIAPIILLFLLSVMLSVSYAIHFWVTFRLLWHYIGRSHIRNRIIWEKFYRFVQLLLLTALAIAFPYLIRLIVFIGNFFLGFNVFIFPAIIETLVCYVDEDEEGNIRWTLFKNIIIFCLGVCSCCSAFFTAVDYVPYTDLST